MAVKCVKTIHGPEAFQPLAGGLGFHGFTISTSLRSETRKPGPELNALHLSLSASQKQLSQVLMGVEDPRTNDPLS